MRTTLIIEDDLMKEAMNLSKLKEKTAVVHMALLALIEKISQKELAAMGGKIKTAKKVPRRR